MEEHVSRGTTCGRTRRLLWPDGGPRAISPEMIEAHDHLSRCPACQRFVRDMRALAEVVRESAAHEPAPGEVRERLFTAIARARAGALEPRRRRLNPRVLAGAAALVVVIGGTLATLAVRREAPVDPLSALVEYHAGAVGETHLASGDAGIVQGWIERQVHFAMLVPVLPEAQLRGARLVVSEGRRGAVVEYDVHGIALSYFVVPDRGASVRDATPMRFEGVRQSGYQVVAWREPGLRHAMVGNLPESRLVSLAKACVEQARRTVASLGATPITREG
ncbi:MAG: hypothetical protein ACT4P7_12430 [Gemmatimonadaceae bacterium]